ncbi:CAF17-like 4Fe-4S cluster assembly/insertion protein YgfZ, partial [Pseudomonas aeruginosa]|uniref:CAF17-like 4Fe-4S cluster assembly/insertion protein YgfZ n=1 Tax=Pseudomonas aeruginosa TaxID=287 RepID=UPI0034D20AC4
MADPAFHTPLVHEGILAVRGPDAAKFLQGQLTCNLAYLNDETSSLGGRCNIKGRLLSSFRILPEGDGLLLAMAGELLEAQLADLKKYAVFSKASLADESAAWLRIGLRDASEALRALGIDTPAESGRIARHGDLLAVALGDARVELWVPAQRAEAVLATLREHSREAPLDDWLLGQVRAGVGQVFGATRELFIPQMINLQAVGGVSFKKGCYTGQEIVARMQYLGRLKRRLYRLALDADEVPAPGTGLFSPVHSTSVGEVVLAARTPENSVELLAVLQDDAVADGRISLGSAES